MTDQEAIAESEVPLPVAAPPSLKDTRPGYRIGPFIFVPEWSRGADGSPDPWAHRKGEPRMLTLAWTVYLLAAAGGTLFSTRAAGIIRAWQYHETARRLLVLIAFGACVLWPMVRLCQARPERSMWHAVITDTLGISLPIAAVLLPLPILTGWGWMLMLAIWAMLSAWAMLTVGVAAMGLSGGTLRRLLVMGGVMIVLAAAPFVLVLVQRGGGELPGWWEMLSPFTGVFRLTDPPSGTLARVTPEDWRVIHGVWAAGVAAWIAAGSSGRANVRRM